MIGPGKRRRKLARAAPELNGARDSMVNPGPSERKRERAISLFNEMMTSAARIRMRTRGDGSDLRSNFPTLDPDRSGCGAIGAGQL